LSEHKENVALFKMYPTDLLSVPNLKDAKAKVSGWFSHDNAPAGGYKILDKVMIAE